MIPHTVTVHPAASRLPREAQLAWKLAALATLPAIDADTASLVAARLIDNAAVALAAINRAPVAAARSRGRAKP
jgi:2-methylcitrate dehydratase